MKNVIFYLEYDSAKEKRKATVKNPGNHSGNCVAVLTDVKANPGKYTALTAVFMWKNSATNVAEVSFGYLRERCKRIPERMCKDIHPELYNRLLDLYE